MASWGDSQFEHWAGQGGGDAPPNGCHDLCHCQWRQGLLASIGGGMELLDPILGKQFESTPKGRLRAQLSATSGNFAILQHAMLQDVEHPADPGAPAESRVIS